MFFSMLTMYLMIKLVYLYSLVRTQIKFDVMQDRWLLLSVLYTGGIAFLSAVLLSAMPAVPWAAWLVRLGNAANVTPWVAWVGVTFALSAVYFFLMSRFNEGSFFWILLLLGLGLVWF